MLFRSADTPFDTPPWEEQRRQKPNMLVHYREDASFDSISPEDIALYVHCACGMSHLAFVRWLLGELETLEAIDPYCSK